MKYLVTNAQQQDFFEHIIPRVGLKIKKIPAHYFYGYWDQDNQGLAFSLDAYIVEVSNRWYRVYYPDLNKFECFLYPENRDQYSRNMVVEYGRRYYFPNGHKHIPNLAKHVIYANGGVLK